MKGETIEKIREEECVGVAVTPEEPIKDLVVTLGEIMHVHAPTGIYCCLRGTLLQPAKHGSTQAFQGVTLKLNFIPLKVSPPLFCLKCCFFSLVLFLSLACERLNFPLIITLPVLGFMC